MTPEEKLIAQKTARVIRASRKQRSFTQKEVADRLGISQSALSKFEHGVLIPSAYQWQVFCEMVEIPALSLKSGLIERALPLEVGQVARVGTFNLPRKFAYNRSTMIRWFLPLLMAAKNNLGENLYFDFMKKIKIDPDYFVDLNHTIAFDLFWEIQNVAWPINESVSTFTEQALIRLNGLFGLREKAILLSQILKSYTLDFKYEVVLSENHLLNIEIEVASYLQRASNDNRVDFCSQDKAQLRLREFLKFPFQSLDKSKAQNFSFEVLESNKAIITINLG